MSARPADQPRPTETALPDAAPPASADSAQDAPVVEGGLEIPLPPGPDGQPVAAPRSLRELVDRVTGRSSWSFSGLEDAGLAEAQPFPFLGLVGQREMKLALLIALVNPAVNGVLLVGPRGIGKTTAVRSLSDLLPYTAQSLCYFGCTAEDVETGGMDAVCPDCAAKYGRGEPLVRQAQVRLVELPLNARLEDVVGGADERAAMHDQLRLRRGILAQADRNLLYIDEVNLLHDEVVDAILDAAAQGHFVVRRGPMSSTYRSRFVLIGSMNPEEGRLRPQILDRFGLRVIVRGLQDPDERLEAYRRVRAFQTSPRLVSRQYQDENLLAQAEIQAVRDGLAQVSLPDEVARLGLRLVQELKIDSLRAELTLFEGARAYAALDGRQQVTPEDVLQVAPLALRMRRSSFMEQYFSQQGAEDQELHNLVNQLRA